MHIYATVGNDGYCSSITRTSQPQPHNDNIIELSVDPGPSPGYRYKFSLETLSWLDTTTIADVKADRWASIKDARIAHEYGGFAWDGSVFDSDPQSQARIQGGVQLATMAAAQPFSIDWTLADNTIRTLSAADMIAVGVALAAHVQGVHATARALRAQIEAATTIAEIEAISWPSQP